MAKKPWIFGKNIVLTGASSGIGYHLTMSLISKFGANIVGIGRDENKLLKVKAEVEKIVESTKFKGSFKYKIMDVSSFEAWVNLKRELEAEGFSVDVLINNAGVILPFEKFKNQDINKALKLININFISHLYSYKTFADELIKNSGALINISSSSALCPVVGTAAYSASKAASKSFTEALIAEHKDELYVAYVCPGFTSTDLFRNEKEISRFVRKISMPAEKMANKILNKIIKRRKRIVVGADAKAMAMLYKTSPKLAMSLVTAILKNSKDIMFDNLFENNKELREKHNKKK